MCYLFYILQKIGQHKQVAPESPHPAPRNPSRTLDFKDAHAGTVPLFNHQNMLTPVASVTSSHPRQNGHSNGGGNHIANGSGLVGAHSNGLSAVEPGYFPPHSNPASSPTFPNP